MRAYFIAVCLALSCSNAEALADSVTDKKARDMFPTEPHVIDEQILKGGLINPNKSTLPERTKTVRAEPMAVSLIQLIANPEKFEGQLVRVKGYLHSKFEDHQLYLGKEDADLLRSMNAVWVDLNKDVRYEPRDTTEQDADCTNVMVEGTFTARDNADFSPGTLQRVYRVLVCEPWYDGKQEYVKRNKKPLR